jgi:hypothetical protein
MGLAIDTVTDTQINMIRTARLRAQRLARGEGHRDALRLLAMVTDDMHMSGEIRVISAEKAAALLHERLRDALQRVGAM